MDLRFLAGVAIIAGLLGYFVSVGLAGLFLLIVVIAVIFGGVGRA